MKKITTIIVPVDFSNVAKNALEYVISLAKAIECKLVLLHVYYITGMSARVQFIAGNDAGSEEYNKAENNMNRFKQATPGLQSVTYETKLIPAYWPIELPELILEQQADFIIMGTNGASGLKEITVGTVTATVAERSVNPVWVIPAPALPVSIKNIGFVMDEEMAEDMDILDPLQFIAEKLSASIHIFCISRGGSEVEQTIIQERKLTAVKQYLKRSQCTHSYISSSKIEADINQYMEEKDIQLISMLSRKQNLLQSLLNCKPVKIMTYRGTAALLVLPGKK